MIKKYIYLVSIFSLLFTTTIAQISIGTKAEPHPSAILDLISSDKGALIPKMKTSQRKNISNPADGLCVYDTDENRLFFYSAKEQKWNGTGEIPDTRQMPDKSPKNGTKVKNVILMIGDGMGFSQVQAGMMSKSDYLTMTTFPYTGIVQTYSYDNKTTDSAASATAMSTGVKTKNYYVGVDPSGATLTTITEEAKQHGLSTGIVVTSYVTHATPAAFYAHRKSRDDKVNIAADFVNRRSVDVCIGGGPTHFTTAQNNTLRSNGYQVVSSLDDITSSATKVFALLANEHMPRMSGGRGNMLSQATAKTLEILSKNENGFFLMVEGSQIDFAGHNHDAKYMMEELVDFDNAVETVKKFAEKEGNTLVIVTADHENGGLIVFGDEKLETYYSRREGVYGAHTSAPVPLFALGPGAENFTGFINNIDIHAKIKVLLGF